MADTPSGSWIGPIVSVAAGATGTKLSTPNLYFDSGAFTVTLDTTGNVPQIKVAPSAVGSATFGNLTALSLALHGPSGQTNLDVTGAALFRGSASIVGAFSFGSFIDLATASTPADPLSGHARVWYDGTSLRGKNSAGTAVPLVVGALTCGALTSGAIGATTGDFSGAITGSTSIKLTTFLDMVSASTPAVPAAGTIRVWFDGAQIRSENHDGVKGTFLPAQFRWSVGHKGLALVDIATPIYELVWANHTGQSVTLTAAWINGGRDGLALDGTDYTEIGFVRIKLDDASGEAALATFDNHATALTAKVDTTITLGGTTIADGYGLYARIRIGGGAGKALLPGIVIYVTT